MYHETNTAPLGWMSPGQSTTRYANGLAAMVLVGAGFFWFGWGCARATPAAWPLWLALYVGTALLQGIAVWTWRAGKAALRAKGSESGAVWWQRHAGAFRRLLRVEACACGLVVALCLVLRRWDLLAAGIGLVVGLHFLPLARLFRFPAYRVTGVAIVAGVMFDTLRFEGVALIGAVGAMVGSILWLTAIFILLRSRRPEVSQATADGS